MNKAKVEEFKVIEIKPGVYLRYVFGGNTEFTGDITQAARYSMDDFGGSSRAARKWFGEVKTLKVTSEVF